MNKSLFAVLVAFMVIVLPGCKTLTYTAVPECEVAPPPEPKRFLQATPDGQRALWQIAYVDSVKQADSCNQVIRAVNLKNKAKADTQ